MKMVEEEETKKRKLIPDEKNYSIGKRNFINQF